MSGMQRERETDKMQREKYNMQRERDKSILLP